MNRLEVYKSHFLSPALSNFRSSKIALKGAANTNVDDRKNLMKELERLGVKDVEVEAPPMGYEEHFRTLLTPEAVIFLADLCRTFDRDVHQLHQRRLIRKVQLDQTGALPDFHPDSASIRQADWKVKPVPRRLQCRHVDLGDVSPSNTEHFVKALRSTAQGIQTDFDDGHCPTKSNQLLGWYNVYLSVHNLLPDVPCIEKAPVLMLRPRAWNMVEHSILVAGQEVPGPLVDFGLLMFHVGQRLFKMESGPYFYLSKVEGFLEARLWDKIFTWTEQKLGLPHGTIKACVLIENILATFEMEEILYELRDHSAGLNCGIWDYSASFVNKFGQRKDFVLPDRSKYVNMDRHFLKSYMDLLIQICHKRGCHATGGMSALLLPDDWAARQQVIELAASSKLKEIHAGVDGFMVYDVGLVKVMQELFKRFAPGVNQNGVKRMDVKVTAGDLLRMPAGGVTEEGLLHNIGVGVLFIEAWLRGKGHFYYKGCVEDSATAEISRSQVWQWIKHQAYIEGTTVKVTRHLVQEAIGKLVQQTMLSPHFDFNSEPSRHRLLAAAEIFEEIVTKRDFPAFITTYLYESRTFLNAHSYHVK